jgi:hypothetical protein
MAIIQLISKARTRWRGNLKGLSLERGWTNSAENLGASPLKRDLSVDTTFGPNKSRWTVPLKTKVKAQFLLLNISAFVTISKEIYKTRAKKA